jgi:EAL and modified HD-GYP domain-containing signal transduction protein
LETIIARQPIFDGKGRLFAYELLYRGADMLSLANIGGDRATSSLLTSSFITEGLEKISGNKPCFVNFTQELLLENLVESFPKNTIVVEILEDVQPTSEIIAVCRELKELGYILALDDFVYHKKFIPLIELANIIKIDFRHTPIDQRESILNFLAPYKTALLAEKVETHEEFAEACKLGFKYFQGYFFARPEEMRIKELATSKLTLLMLLFEINKKSVSAKKMTEIISADVSLSYRLLRYINSAYFYLIKEIQSISYAVTYLGENEIRRFVTLAVISEISSNKPAELVRLAAVRAKFCEQLGQACPRQTKPNELFMLGLFSLLHAMLDTPIDEILSKIPVSDDIKQALSHRAGPLSGFLQIVLAYERGNSEECFLTLKSLRIPEKQLYPSYLSSLKFADMFVNL